MLFTEQAINLNLNSFFNLILQIEIRMRRSHSYVVMYNLGHYTFPSMEISILEWLKMGMRINDLVIETQ